MLTEFFAKRKLRRQLGEYISADAVEAIIEGRPLDTDKIQAGRIEFVFVLVRADSPEQLAERVGVVTEIGLDHDAVIHDLIGPMIVMAFGTLRAVQHSPTSRAELVIHLQQRLGRDLRIVHGAAEGHFGLFGSDNRISFTFTFPHFDKALTALGQLEFGRTQELLP
jgi:hypothetical protein